MASAIPIYKDTMKSFILFLGLLLGVCHFSFALENAKKASPQQLESVVTLHLKDSELGDYDFFCSGVLIAPNKVVTAGHCIVGMAHRAYYDFYRLMRRPEVVSVHYKGQEQRARSISVASNYFEDSTLAGIDLAMIELPGPFTNSRPIDVANLSDLKVGMEVAMVAGGSVAETTLKEIKTFKLGTALLTDPTHSRICRGDSGGALLVKINGQLKLAGILIFEGDHHKNEECNEERNVSFYPITKF